MQSVTLCTLHKYVRERKGGVIQFRDDEDDWMDQVLVRETRGQGKGLFAARDIPKGASITVYVGREVLCGEEIDRYTMTNVRETRTLRADPEMLLAGAHFVNEGSRVEERNATISNWFVWEATRDIRRGEQILGYTRRSDRRQ